MAVGDVAMGCNVLIIPKNVKMVEGTHFLGETKPG